MRVRFACFAMIAAGAALALAQPPGARGKATATVKGKQVVVDYGRPELKGRKIDDLLGQLPPDRMWRAGLNQVTTLETGLDLMIGGKKVPAGKYSLYVHAPKTGDWQLAINSDPGIELIKIYPQAPPAVAQALWPRLDGYSKIADKEVARVALQSGTASPAVEMFTITLEPGGGGGTLKLAWGDKTWSVRMTPAG